MESKVFVSDDKKQVGITMSMRDAELLYALASRCVHGDLTDVYEALNAHPLIIDRYSIEGDWDIMES